MRMVEFGGGRVHHWHCYYEDGKQQVYPVFVMRQYLDFFAVEASHVFACCAATCILFAGGFTCPDGVAGMEHLHLTGLPYSAVTCCCGGEEGICHGVVSCQSKLASSL